VQIESHTLRIFLSRPRGKLDHPIDHALVSIRLNPEAAKRGGVVEQGCKKVYAVICGGLITE